MRLTASFLHIIVTCECVTDVKAAFAAFLLLPCHLHCDELMIVFTWQRKSIEQALVIHAMQHRYCQFLVKVDTQNVSVAVNRCRLFQRGRRSYTRSFLTHATCCWRPRSASRCLSSMWRSGRRKNDERSATSWKRGRNSLDNFLKKHISPASMICFHWRLYVFVQL